MAKNIPITPGSGAIVDTTEFTVGAIVSEVQSILNYPLALKKTVSGTTTYFGLALPGTTQAAANWRCFKVDESSGMVITWADGDFNFDNVATDLTALTYS